MSLFECEDFGVIIGFHRFGAAFMEISGFVVGDFPVFASLELESCEICTVFYLIVFFLFPA